MCAAVFRRVCVRVRTRPPSPAPLPASLSRALTSPLSALLARRAQDGVTALDMARLGEHTEVVQLLEAAVRRAWRWLWNGCVWR